MQPEDGFTALYERHYRAIWAYVARRIPAGTDPADSTADVFATAWRRRDRIPPEPDSVLWLYATARRVVANCTRSAHRHQRLWGRLAGLRESQELLDGDSPDGTRTLGGHADERHAEVRAALDRLRPAEREALRLAIWEDLPVQNIAVVLGCTPNAASLRLRRARESLRAELTAAPRAAPTAPPRVLPTPTHSHVDAGGHHA